MNDCAFILYVHANLLACANLVRRNPDVYPAEPEIRQGDTPKSVLEWCKNFRMSKGALDKAISNWTWRKHLNKDLNY